jgi:uncharacterized OB-fold protein
MIPVVENMFTAGEQTQLLASKCPQCASVFFPRRAYCRNPACRREPLADVLLSRTGKLHSVTVQHYPPPAPFRLDPELLPYGVALVDFPEGVRVMGMIDHGVDAGDLRPETPMEVTAGRLYTRDDGEPVVTWKFRPTQA